jgi:hypothetical protein
LIEIINPKLVNENLIDGSKFITVFYKLSRFHENILLGNIEEKDVTIKDLIIENVDIPKLDRSKSLSPTKSSSSADEVPEMQLQSSKPPFDGIEMRGSKVSRGIGDEVLIIKENYEKLPDINIDNFSPYKPPSLFHTHKSASSQKSPQFTSFPSPMSSSPAVSRSLFSRAASAKSSPNSSSLLEVPFSPISMNSFRPRSSSVSKDDDSTIENRSLLSHSSSTIGTSYSKTSYSRSKKKGSMIGSLCEGLNPWIGSNESSLHD